VIGGLERRKPLAGASSAIGEERKVWLAGRFDGSTESIDSLRRARIVKRSRDAESLSLGHEAVV
jgi:hypothetical protein